MTLKTKDFTGLTEKATLLSQDESPVEIGDIMSEYNRKWQQQMSEIIQNHKTYAPKYYILQYIKKEPGHINILRNKCFVRKTRPDPDWNTDCYSYDNRSSIFKLEWSLPPAEAAPMILKNPSSWDALVVQSIERFLSGELRKPLPEAEYH